MKENISCFYLPLNVYLLIIGFFMLKYTPTMNKPSSKARSDAHPPDNGKNAFLAGFTTQVIENTRSYAAEITLLHNFHQATCPIKHIEIFMINTQYVNYRHQRRL